MIFGRLGLLLLLLVASVACKSRDRYECGIRVGTGVAICDGAGEVCVCGNGPSGDLEDRLRRCARYDEDCRPKGEPYRFVFGDEECVGDVTDERVELRTGDPANPEQSLCPEIVANAPVDYLCGYFKDGERKVCGNADGTQVCACDSSAEGTCVSADPGCSSGYIGESGCIDVGEFVELTIVAPEGLCPDAPALTRFEECGSQDATHRIGACASGECACENGKGYCSGELASCPSGHVWRADGPLTMQCVPESYQPTINGVCPGADTSERARCGEPGPAGERFSCETSETCICLYGADDTFEGGDCVKTDTDCLSGHRRVSDNECLELGEDVALAALSGGGSLCATKAPTGMACGADIEVECGVGAACSCGSTSPQCVTNDQACESRHAFLGTRRCVPMALLDQIETTSACAAAGGN